MPMTPIPRKGKFQKNKTRVSVRAQKCFNFVLNSKSGDEVAGDNFENYENSQLTLKNLLHLL